MYQIWCPLLEKAFAVHAGGWDKLEGGLEQIGLACLTGCMDTFSIQKYVDSLDAAPIYKMTRYVWETFKGNNFYEAGELKWHGGFNGGKQEVSADVLFEHLCEWDTKQYIVCAGSESGSGSHDIKQEGIADSHAYSLISAKKKVCGTFDLLCFRNPWGHGEFTGGGWHDGGIMWQKNPGAKKVPMCLTCLYLMSI
jgi:hypothetical protein